MKEKGFVSPHPWENYYREQLQKQAQQLTVPTNNGENLYVEALRSTTLDWVHNKALTSSCVTCPLYVAVSQTDEVIEGLSRLSRSHITPPQNLAGLCVFPRTHSEITKYRTIHKFLVTDNSNPTGCNIKEDKRMRRAEGMRAKGELFGSLVVS